MPREAFGQQLPTDTKRRVEELLEEMTHEELVGQLVGIPPYEDVERAKAAVTDHHIGSVHFGGTPHNTPAEKAAYVNELQRAAIDASRFDVPLFVRAMAEHGHAAISGSTVFPQQLALGATRNPELAARVASVAATEMRATGVQSTSSPVGDVARDQRWGRIAESFGESPRLCAALTGAMVRGYQEGERDESVLAVTKHFPAYSEPVRGEDQAPNDVSEYTLRRVHTPPYEAGIEAGTAGIMPCYNAIDGEPVHGSRRYLHGLLRENLGFAGFTLADYAGAEDLHGGHRVSGSLEESLWQAVRAGIDVFPSGGVGYAERLVSLVEDGELSRARIEESARRVLRAKFALDLFEDPFVDVEGATATLGNDAHRDTARETARESMTLLKNDGGVLPLAADVERLLVTGPNADDIANQHGGWGSVRDPAPLGETVLEGIREEVDDGTDVVYERGVSGTETLDVEAARERATSSDAAVVVLGEPDYVHEFRGSTKNFTAEEFPHREQLTLPEAQRELVEAIHETGTPTVVVFVTGRVLATPWIAEHVPAILLAYQPGSAGGAVADVLLGEHNPSGKLPISIPRSEGQVPVQFNHLTHPTLDHEAHRSSYDPLFEYGHGLSYTDFEYQDLSLSATEVGPDDTVEVDVTLANTGDRDGTEVVEVFSTDVLSSRVTPVRELQAFERVELAAGQRTTVSFSLDVDELGIVQNDGTRTVEPGTFEIRVDDLVAEFDVTRNRPYRR
ncbi:MAG: glycoside hydrolase family 3 N-terminal domain-containing protein [Halobacteriaceae archaeon]